MKSQFLRKAGSRLLLLSALAFSLSTSAFAADTYQPELVNTVAIPDGKAVSLAVHETGARTFLLVEHEDGSVDSIDVTFPTEPKLKTHIGWPPDAHLAGAQFVGALAVVDSAQPAPSDRVLVLLDNSNAKNPVELHRFEHTRDSQIHGDFLYVLTFDSVSIVRIHPEPDPAALASLYGG